MLICSPCSCFLYDLQMRHRSFIAGSLDLELDLSFWMMLTAEGMRQTLKIVHTGELVTTTVFTGKSRSDLPARCSSVSMSMSMCVLMWLHVLCVCARSHINFNIPWISYLFSSVGIWLVSKKLFALPYIIKSSCNVFGLSI